MTAQIIPLRPEETSVVDSAFLTLDPIRRTLARGNVFAQLTLNETIMMGFLLKGPVAYERLLPTLNGIGEFKTMRSLYIQAYHLRKKLKQFGLDLASIRAWGYELLQA